MEDLVFLNNMQDAKDKKQLLVDKLIQVKEELSSFYKNESIKTVPFSLLSKEQKERRALLTDKIQLLEKELIAVKKCYRGDNNRFDILKDLLKETLTPTIYDQISSELNRRVDGEPPTRIPLNIEASQKAIEKNKFLMKELSWYSNALMDARRGINKYIFDNEPEINKADFLKSVSELNKCAPTVSDIEKRSFKIKKTNEI